VTAVAVGSSYGVRRPSAAAPVKGATPLRRIAGTFHEPNAWTVSLLLATGLIIIARHPIAHLLGTEVDTTPTTTVQAPAAVVGSSSLVPSAPTLSAGVAVPTHAPVDPFRPLVSMTGKLLAPVPLVTSAAARLTSTTTGVKDAATAAGVTPTTTSACAGAVHRVVSGDSLWTLAARATRSTDSGTVTVAWHQLYAANRATLGSNPSLLRIGEQICIPTKL
jgi:nucleoid-associated protein YgaU